MLPLLLVLLVCVPLAELYVIVQAGQAFGVLPTLGLLLAVSLLGGWLLKREGTRAWRALRAASAAGRVPAKEVADGALVVLGGALLLTPGFLTDAVGLLLVLPPTRAAVRQSLMTGLVRRALGPYGALGWGVARAARRRRAGRAGAPGPVGDPGAGAGPVTGPREGVVDGEVLDRRQDPPRP